MKKKSPTKKKRHAGQPQNLTPGRRGKPTHSFKAPLAWDIFCINWKLTGKPGLAATRAGYPSNYGYHLTKHPWIIARKQQITDEMVTAELVKAAKEYVMCEETLDDELMKVVRSVSHEKRGYADKVAAIRHGNELLGRTQSGKTTINNQANATAGAAVGLTASRLYLPDWRKENIDKIRNDEQLQSGNEVQASE